MLSKVIIAVLTGIAFRYFLVTRDWTDWSKEPVLNVKPGQCDIVIKDKGSEDLTHIGNNIVLLSTGFEFGGGPGQIKALDLNNGNKVTTLTITNAPERSDFMAAPHGITTWKDPETGELFLYVLCHPTAEDRVEVLEVLTESLALKYVKTITDPLFTFMNDLVAVGKHEFYITKFCGYRNFYLYHTEMILGIKNGAVLYYDGQKARQLASGYFFPNGINISPDKKWVYVAEWGTKTLLGFKRHTDNSLDETWSLYTGTGIDNIEVDPVTGDLWIGCHPVTRRIIDVFSGTKPPGQVVRVKMQDNAVSDIEVIYQDSGTYSAGSTAASYVAGKLVLGTVREQTVVCDVNYLSK